jgi:hypothetical protein
VDQEPFAFDERPGVHSTALRSRPIRRIVGNAMKNTSPEKDLA